MRSLPRRSNDSDSGVSGWIGPMMRIANTVLSFGLSALIEKVRSSRYAKYVVALLILNEVRGAYFVYTAADHFLPWLR